MKPMHLALLAALLALPVVAGGDRINSAPVVTLSAHYNTDMPRFAAGQILILDPKAQFDYAARASDIRGRARQRGEPVVGRTGRGESPVKGGGYRVNLRGRFQNAMTMSIDAKGIYHVVVRARRRSSGDARWEGEVACATSCVFFPGSRRARRSRATRWPRPSVIQNVDGARARASMIRRPSHRSAAIPDDTGSAAAERVHVRRESVGRMPAE